MSDAVHIGDRIRISVELLKMLYENQSHESETVILERILDDDGVKVLVLAVEEKR